MATLDFGRKNFELIVAAESGNLPGVEKAVAEGAQVNHPSMFDKMTALHIAAGNGNDAMVDYLLSVGADVKLQDKYGRTPSVVAIECGWYELADRLTDLECQFILETKHAEYEAAAKHSK